MLWSWRQRRWDRDPSLRSVQCGRKLRNALFIGVLALVMSGCGGVQNVRSQLRDSVREYNVAVRWGHVQKAATFIPQVKRAEFVVRKRQAMARMQIHEVSIRNVRLLGNNEAAIVLVQLSFSVGADPIIRNHLVEQRWRYENAQWLLMSRRRVKTAVTGRAPQPGDLY